MIRILILVSNLSFLDVARFWYFVSNVCPEKTSLKHVSDKVARANWPHGTSGNIMCLSTSGLFNCICHWNLGSLLSLASLLHSCPLLPSLLFSSPLLSSLLYSPVISSVSLFSSSPSGWGFHTFAESRLQAQPSLIHSAGSADSPCHDWRTPSNFTHS